MEQASYKKRLSNKYTYHFADGTTATVKAGEDGVTETDVYELIRAENREVENNYKNWAPVLTRKEKAEWKKQNPSREYERVWTIPISYFRNAEGEEAQDRVAMSGLWDQGGLPADDVLTLREAVKKLNPEQQWIVSNLMAGVSLSEMARRAGKSKMAFSKKLAAIRNIIKEIFAEN